MAGLDEHFAIEGEVDIGAGAEADHAEALAFFQVFALGGPGDDAAGDEAGDLAEDEGAVGSFEEPVHGFVTDIDFRVAGVEEFTGMVVDFGDAAGGGGAVDVDIEDGEEDGDAFHGGMDVPGFLDGIDGDDAAIGSADDVERVGGDGSFGVAEEPEDVGESGAGHEGEPGADPQAKEGDDAEDEEEGAGFTEGHGTGLASGGGFGKVFRFRSWTGAGGRGRVCGCLPCAL